MRVRLGLSSPRAMRSLEDLPKNELFPDRKEKASEEDLEDLRRLSILLTKDRGQFITSYKAAEVSGKTRQYWDRVLNRLWRARAIRKFAHVGSHWKHKSPTGIRWWIWG